MKKEGPKKGDRLELRIASLAPGGEGVSKDFGLPIFVNRVAQGDHVLVEVFDRRSDFARGRVLEILSPSPDRIEPPCKLFKVCGGCQWQHIDYQAQLTAKERIIEQSLKHIGGMASDVVQRTVPSEKPFFYRNKVQFPVRQPKDSTRILAGYYEQDSHRLVNVKHCPIQPGALDQMLEVVKASLEHFGVSAHNEETGKGLLRFITARYSEATEQILITLVINCECERMPEILNTAASDIQAKLPQVAGVCVNFNARKGNRILGDETICLSGIPYVEEVLRTKREFYPQKLRFGIRFRLSSNSFFQVNTAQAVNLFEQISDILLAYSTDEKVPLEEMTLVDAYAGVGAIALWLSPFVKRVVAIEENLDAVQDGQLNININEVNNVEMLLGTVEQMLPSLFNQGVRPEAVIVDPPRKGCSEAVLATIKKLAPALIIYVSCNPVTLARDLRFLADVETNCGYKTEKIIPVDLFPQTYHVESITVLRRVKTDD